MTIILAWNQYHYSNQFQEENCTKLVKILESTWDRWRTFSINAMFMTSGWGWWSRSSGKYRAFHLQNNITGIWHTSDYKLLENKNTITVSFPYYISTWPIDKVAVVVNLRQFLHLSASKMQEFLLGILLPFGKQWRTHLPTQDLSEEIPCDGGRGSWVLLLKPWSICQQKSKMRSHYVAFI